MSHVPGPGDSLSRKRRSPKRAPAKPGPVKLPQPPETRATRHQVARARTLGWAQDAADRGDHKDALEWLYLIEFVDGVLPADWERTRTVWRELACEQRLQARPAVRPAASPPR
jgi:hypothetical protein